MSRLLLLLFALQPVSVELFCASAPHAPDDPPYGPPLTILAIGDAGETGSALRANAGTMTDMLIGRHDGGKFQALFFLGDNFYTTGLNVPAADVDGKVKSVLGPFREIFDGLGRDAVHAIPGNNDYYRRNAIETRFLFGLFSIAEGPVGITNRGNQREAAVEWWSYHYGLPAQITFPAGGASPDSVQFLFFDSALLLRTDPRYWRPALDSLARLLSASRRHRGIAWRILAVHHPFLSVGEHAGYTVWNDELNVVEYLTNCDKDSNAVAWVKNWLDPEDLCADRYRNYIDSVTEVVRGAGVRIQAVLSGHEHSLQLLPSPDRTGKTFPGLQIISGAGSTPARVKLPGPPFEFTSAQPGPEKEGLSFPGFVQLAFREDRLRVTFFNGLTGDPIDMGGARKVFWVDREGQLVDDAQRKGR